MKTSDFDYQLPPDLIAQSPAPVRDECRMLVTHRSNGRIEDKIFRNIVEYLHPGDLLVANETRVRPSRLLGHKRGTGGEAEVLLLREHDAQIQRQAQRTQEKACQAQGQTEQQRLIRDAQEEHTQEKSLRGLSLEGTPARESHSQDTLAQKASATQALSPNQCALWEALVRPGKRLKPGTGAVVDFTDASGSIALSAEVVDWANNSQKGERIVRLTTSLPSLDEALHAVGRAPLPPYIRGYAGDDEMYQTVYSQRESSAAAPTAGLHFTPELIERLRNSGVGWETVELEVGLDTFRVVDEENAEDHAMHTEVYTVPERTVAAIERCKREGGRVVAVGTTSVRSLESAALASSPDGSPGNSSSSILAATSRASTSLYIMPGYEFKVVDTLVTNFHVPRSTLMMLVSAFAGYDNTMRAYAHAIAERYRFLSFGDAMLIV